MSNEYINKEVDQIINDKKLAPPANYAMACAWILGNLKGINLKVLRLGEKSSLAEFFVIASANNAIQAVSMGDELAAQFKRHGIQCRSKEGQQDSDWILLDFGEIIVHIFLEMSRPIYNLDALWADAESLTIPQSYYFSTPEIVQTESTKKSDKGYF